ncbi:WD repeat-containing protein 97 [Poeciliopsis prolifica]|uniref:WD repeat-containing protein 97 n=1 Tax=Poeciliopsis prolifica TaxID=188132 RepID=UPI002412FFD6|nr:WD repeat-containing protein 97 [Poeciliopsis prolifica]
MTEPTIHQAEKFLIFDKRQTGNKIFVHEEDEHFLVHGFYHFKHFSCESPVRFMLHSPANHAFISLHTDNKVTFYRPKCYREIIWKKMPFLGLTPTKLLGWIIGWGPGPIFTLLDNELRHLDTADNALDIRLCEAVEHSWEMVTAGIGNVCVWSVLLMRCRVMIQEGLQQRAFTHMALAPPQKKRPHCAIVACGKDVTVIDLDNGIVLDHQEELAPSEITAMLFCTHLNCLITGFEDYAITVWGLDWVPCVTFFGHDGVVNSLFYCSKSNLLISCSADCTIRSWDVKRNLAIDCFHTEHNNPPLCLGGIKNEHPFFSFSEKGVDLWFLTAWYTLHTKIKGDENIALKHILVSHLPPCYPTRVTCVSEDDHIYLVSVGTEEILTSFKAGKRVLCAAYCLQKELLFVLTQCGSLLQVNPLTNPATLIQEWEGKGQAPWTSSDTISKKDVLNLPVPGPACCMVIYSSLGDPEKALEKWKSLQSRRGSIHRDTKQIDHFKNRFWVIIGQIGGCVSVLAMDDGTILFRTPAHNGNNVTAVKAYPKNNCLLSSGADFTVIVWRVHPDAATCLTKNQMVICYERQVYLAALELYVALEFQEPNSNFYSLQLYHMENLKRAECQQNNAHIDSLTGVCAIPEIKAFASCSLDKTVRIWNEKNKLIWVQQLVAAPQCMEYSGNGELFLGMNGDLYRLEFAQFLPKKYRRKFRCYYFENVLPELPIAEVEETPDKEDTSVAETERLKEAIISNEVMNIYLEQEMEATMIIDMDAKALIKGEVVCTQKRTHSTNKTKKEAFDHFMRELYGLSPCEQIGEEDEENFEDIIMATKARLMRAIYVPKPKPVVHPAVTTEEPAETEKQVSKKKVAKKAATGPQLKTVVAKQAQAKVEKMEKVKGRYTQMDKVKKLSSTVESIQVTPQFRRSPQKPQVPSILLPVPTPAQTQKISQVTPSVVSQFSRTEWFSDVFPDRKHIGSDTTSENVFQQLLKYVQNSNGKANSKVLEAVRAAKALQSQNLFDVTDKQYTNLTEAWEKFIRPSMSNQAREVVVEMLNLLVDLKPEVSSNLAKKLIIFMANKELNLQRPILRLIEGLSVHQAHFLEHEFQNWGEGLESNPNKLEIIDKKADCWLEKWTSKFKVYNRFQNTETSSQWKRPSFSGLDVLKFFCLMKKEEIRKSCFIPAVKKYKVLVPQEKWRFKPLFRLGETYTMARKWRKTRYCFFEPNFPNWIHLPLSRVNLRPFHTNSYERLVRLPTRTYFIPRQSTGEYYERKFKISPVMTPATPPHRPATPPPTPELHLNLFNNK